MRLRRLIAPASLALAGMLFLQAAAFAACELPDRSAAMAVAMVQGQMPDCHEADHDAGLCLGHCANHDQTASKAQLQVPDLSLHPAVAIRSEFRTPTLAVLHRRTYFADAGPPPRILFQFFLL